MTTQQTVSRWKYTEEELQALVGKHLLVGVAYCSSTGAVVSREQFHGTILRVNFKEGIIINQHGTNIERTVPLDFTEFEAARPGKYHLKSTNEVVEDPDYTIQVNINQ